SYTMGFGDLLICAAENYKPTPIRDKDTVSCCELVTHILRTHSTQLIVNVLYATVLFLVQVTVHRGSDRRWATTYLLFLCFHIAAVFLAPFVDALPEKLSDEQDSDADDDDAPPLDDRGTTIIEVPQQPADEQIGEVVEPKKHETSLESSL